MFYYFCSRSRPHSSMDRISDSGSDDLGSNPDGVTYLFLNALYISTIQGAFFIYIHVYIQKRQNECIF